MRQGCLRLSILLFAALLVVGCSRDKKKSGIFSRMPEPSMDGNWTGTLNTATSTSTLTMSVVQGTLDVDGTYEAPLSQASVFGTGGTVEGVTSGASFLLTLTPDDPGCHASIQLGGVNDGTEMQFSFSGVDCASATFQGQGYFNKN